MHTGQGSISAIDDSRMAITLLYILRMKDIINKPTYDNTLRIYEEKLRKVA